MPSDTIAYVKWFRNSTPYINAHRDKTVVIAFSGEAVSHVNFNHILQDIVLMHSLDIRIVLIHGARPQINKKLKKEGLPNQIKYHRRITDLKTLPSVIEAISHTKVQVEAALSQQIAAVHLKDLKATVNSGNFIIAKPYGIHHGIDFQHSGQVRRINHSAITQLLNLGSLVLLSPLGYSPTGEVFNLLWEEVAEATAVALQADKLIYLNNNAGIQNVDGKLIRELTVSEADQVMQKITEPDHTLISASNAVRKGVDRAHIISYQSEEALLQELFTVDGQGTLLTKENYEKIRIANIDDVASILELIEPLEQDGTLVRRSRERLEDEVQYFTLIERDEKIIACAALYPYKKERIGELACVAVHPDYRHGQRGDTLIKELEQQAYAMGLTALFVLTTQTAHWFQERGFLAADIAKLPQHKQSLYNYQRNAKVFLKKLTRER